MNNPSNLNLAMQLDIPGYALGISMLTVVMLFHGTALIQIAKRYEVKSFLYLAEHKYSEVTVAFYISILCLFFTHILEIILWGVCLWMLDLMPNLGLSIYFSGSNYTAMGFSNDALQSGWQILSVIIAFSGMFAFAWTASVMISMTKNFRQAYTRLHMKRLNIAEDIIKRFE